MSLTTENRIALFNWKHSSSKVYTMYRYQAERQFWRAHSRGKWRARLLRLDRNERSLLDLPEALRSVRVNARHYLGRESVPVDQIRGSEGRSHDFDSEFNPLRLTTMERWIDIAIAQQIGMVLPPVDLIQLGEVYFVRDGHHRISVARFNGQEQIDAEVTVWEI
jgi:hypothetical protein